jgi:squalene-hopene/tetraprenyl-beta-curcumene cyclase
MVSYKTSITSLLGRGKKKKKNPVDHFNYKNQQTIDDEKSFHDGYTSIYSHQISLEKKIELAISKSQAYLLSQQNEEGYWVSELEANTTITSEYILFYRFLGKVDNEKEKKAVELLMRTIQSDGGWNLYYGGPSELSTSVEAYFALKMAGVSIDDPAMKKAKVFIIDNGGIEKCRVFTKKFLALFGLYEWEKLPSMPVEMMLLPNWFYFNIYEFSSWSRSVIVPLLIILAKRPVCYLPDSFSIDELYASNGHSNFKNSTTAADYWKLFFNYFDKYFLKVLDSHPFHFMRKKAIKKAEKWVIEHQDKSGNWGGIIPAMMNSIIALRSLGYGVDDIRIKKGLEVIESFRIENSETLCLQSCISPVWDTAITCNALRKSGIQDDHPALIKAVNWLIDRQILKEGDWKVKNKEGEPGGWAFEFENDFYPDNDDTTEVLVALRNIAVTPENRGLEAFNKGLRWLLSMQSSNGGWAAFDVDNNKRLLNKIPFADLESLLDPPSNDVTGRVLWLLGILGYRTDYSPVRDALNFLKKNQEPDGIWYGRWGVNYIYGTFLVLIGLKAIGEDMNQGYIQRAVNWLKIHQNKDGGWGESCKSYEDKNFIGVGASTASQTAWALLGLLAADESTSSFVQKGTRYLLDRQNNDGTWDENEYTGTGFPKHFYIKYHMYRNYFPLLALAEYYYQIKSDN